MRVRVWLALICLGALALRIGLALNVDFPGVADPNHYYNLAVRLIEGQGFTIDYIWQYSADPASIVHPEEHWMPLAAALAALPMAVFGVSVHAAILPFILIGSALPVLAFIGVRRLRLSDEGALFAAGAVAFLPEMVLNSLRTDTTIPFALFTSAALLLSARLTLPRALGVGALAGFAYLTRSDGTLIIAAFAWHVTFNGDFALSWRPMRFIPAAIIAFVVVILPWLVRNLDAFGAFTSPETRIMWFFTHHDDHYAYGRTFSLETLLAAQTPTEIISKRLFEMAAGGVMMLRAFGDALAVAVIGGLALILARRDGSHRRMIAPALFFVMIVFIAYTIMLPYKAQAGSLKKAFLGAVPLLIPLAALALDWVIEDRRVRRGAMALILIVLAVNAVQLVRTDTSASAVYLAQVERAAGVARTLPDTNGDGDLILMTQDPFIVRYVGFRSIMYPYEDRDTIHAAALRYGVDYLLMPANRPSLNALYEGDDADPRFIPAADVPGTPF
ncbi:MAG: hypothetical protein CUN53_09080, partial [Phototrophicales bacterium]